MQTPERSSMAIASRYCRWPPAIRKTTQKTITDLMGNKPELRFEFIREKANLYKEFNL